MTSKTQEPVVKLKILLKVWKKYGKSMEVVLKENDYKGGWDDCGLLYLEARLVEEVGEYFKVVANSHVRSGGGKELLDVANFCMMIYNRIVIKDT